MGEGGKPWPVGDKSTGSPKDGRLHCTRKIPQTDFDEGPHGHEGVSFGEKPKDIYRQEKE